MSYFHITGNFATEGQCGKCKHMILCGCVIGICKANNYEYCMTEDDCNCGMYENGEPEWD